MRASRVLRIWASGRSTALWLCAPMLALAGCASAPERGAVSASPRAVAGVRVPAYNRPYQVRGRWYTPHDQPGYDQVGVASWYSYEAPSRRTSNGEPFDIGVASAAHTTLPIPSWLEVTNLDNGRRARVRLNDRGPFVSTRILDLSKAGAEQLGFVSQGTAHVRVRYLGAAEPLGGAPSLWTSAPRVSPAPRPPAQPTPRYAEGDDIPPADPRAEVADDSAAAGTPRPRPPTLEAVAYTPATLAFSEPSSEAPQGGFEVQAGAFADRGNAERAAARLGAAGQARVRPLQRGEAVLYRVTVGPWTDADRAASARAQVVRLGFLDACVVAR